MDVYGNWEKPMEMEIKEKGCLAILGIESERKEWKWVRLFPPKETQLFHFVWQTLE